METPLTAQEWIQAQGTSFQVLPDSFTDRTGLSTMFDQLKQRWHHFTQAVPGERFKEHCKRRQQARPSALHKKILAIGGGILIMGVGLFFLPAPGPGTLILFVGALLIAQESFAAARALDWADLRLRRMVAWSLRVWRRSSVEVKLLLVLGAMAVLGTVGLGTFNLLWV